MGGGRRRYEGKFGILKKYVKRREVGVVLKSRAV